MTASILTIGDEILIGQIVNTNAAWLGNELTGLGIVVHSNVTVGDNVETIVSAISEYAASVDYLFVTGGLGPTHDDRTKEAVCRLLNCGVVEDADQVVRIEQRFSERKIVMNDRSRSQAQYPSAASVLANEHGNAAAFEFDFNDAHVYVLPGVPPEMTGICKDIIWPKLSATRGTIIQQTFLTYGIAESLLADKLLDVYALLDSTVTLAFLPSDGVLRLRVMCTSSDARARARYEAVLTTVRAEAKAWIVSESDEPLAATLGSLLKENNLTIALSESCTGGLIGYLLTTIPGSSTYYLGGVAAYSYQAKEDLLSVSREMLEQYGAVSREVCEAMASGVRINMKSDIAISVTGIAGPDGGIPGKPVGTVWIGVSTRYATTAHKYSLGDQRDVVRKRTANIALVMAIKSVRAMLAERTLAAN